MQSGYNEDIQINQVILNSNLDLININAYTKFGEILSICSQNIEWKQNYGVNQGP